MKYTLIALKSQEKHEEKVRPEQDARAVRVAIVGEVHQATALGDGLCVDQITVVLRIAFVAFFCGKSPPKTKSHCSPIKQSA